MEHRWIYPCELLGQMKILNHYFHCKSTNTKQIILNNNNCNEFAGSFYLLKKKSYWAICKALKNTSTICFSVPRQGMHFWVCITICWVRHGDSVAKPDYYYQKHRWHKHDARSVISNIKQRFQKSPIIVYTCIKIPNVDRLEMKISSIFVVFCHELSTDFVCPGMGWTCPSSRT